MEEDMVGNLLETFFWLYLISAVVCGGFAAGVADAKGRNQWAWFFGGLVFSILALIAVVGIPTMSAELEEKAAVEEREERAEERRRERRVRLKEQQRERE